MKEFKLVFEEDFSKDGKINTDHWTYQQGGHGWGNKELQYYTDRLDNLFIKDGVLNIVAIKEPYENCQWTSARITTAKKLSWQYGKVEVTAKLPKGSGSWPAIWMLGENIKEVGWPTCGEIDIMEHVGQNQDVVHFSLHTEKMNHTIGTQRTKFLRFEGVSETFKKYGFEWDEKGFTFFVDDIEQARFLKNEEDNESTWPFDQPFHLILNLAIGGWGGDVDPSYDRFVYQISKIQVFKK